MRIGRSAWLLIAIILLVGCAAPASTSAPAAVSPSGEMRPGGGTGAPTATFAGVRIEHNYTAAAETKTFVVPANAGSLSFSAYFRSDTTAGGQMVCPPTQSPLKLRVTTPSGRVAADQTWDGQGFTTTGDASCNGGSYQQAATLEAGAWTVAFTGSGASIVGVVSVEPAN